MRKRSGIIVVLVMSILCNLVGISFPANAAEFTEENSSTEFGLQYSVVQGQEGVSELYKEAQTAGSVEGENYLSAIYIDAGNDSLNSEIEYAVYSQGKEWGEYVQAGQTAKSNNTGIEAVKIRLIGETANKYNIYYRVYMDDLGWTNWARNDAPAGSLGYGKCIKAIEIQHREINNDELANEEETYLQKQENGPDKNNPDSNSQISEETIDEVPAHVTGIKYQAHVAHTGWQEEKVNGEMAGTNNKASAIEALKIGLVTDAGETADPLLGSVEYSAHVSGIGWQDYVANAQLAGTVGRSKRMEAVKIRLTGDVAKAYDIYYRAYIQSYGWLGWTMNDKVAGSTGYAKRLEAIEIQLVIKGEQPPGETEKSYLYPRIKYQAHVSSEGWQSSVYENAIAGTTGKKRRLEVLKIELPGAEYEGNIEYRAYLQTYGWQDWKSNGALAGTTGQSKRIEAIEIRLTGEMAQYYDVCYSVHLSKIGWCNYAVNGETTGSIKLSKPIEAIKIKLVKKGEENPPDVSGKKYIEGYDESDFYYKGWLQNLGYTNNIAQGATLGTVGQKRRLENITLYLNERSESGIPQGNIQYSTHLSGTGWQGWTDQGNISGCLDNSRAIEAVKIKLSGDISKFYDIYYRVHVQQYGWLGWAVNGQAAGTTKCRYQMEAIQIKLVPKDATKPGENKDYYTEKKKVTLPNDIYLMQTKANMYSSATGYIVLVNRSTHKVGVFRGWQGNWSNVHYWDCSDGKASTPTVEGVFKVGSRGYYFDSYPSRCYWYTQFYGNYLFHSVLYYPNGNLMDGRLGMALSHGCVRLKLENAKWIYDNIPTTTTVVVYH